MKSLTFIFWSTSFFLLCSGCEEKIDPGKFVEYEGPVTTLDGAEIMHSDSAIITAKIITDKLLQFTNGDQEMPSGFHITFFDSEGKPNATLRADYAYNDKQKNLWKATGAVELNNIKTGEKLNTEELFWDPPGERIFTEKFVRIESEDQILLGEGLTASQDFTTYKIHKLTGEIVFNLDGEPSANPRK